MYVTLPPCGRVTCPPAAVPMLPSNARPRIVQVSFPNGLVIGRHRLDDVYLGHEQFHPGQFLGSITVSSNVASVELRTNLFSIDATKTGVGRFAFDVDVYDVPPIFLRSYTLRIIARNTAGDTAEEDLPFRIE